MERTHRVGSIRSGVHKGAVVREDDTLECPRYEMLDGAGITIVAIIANGEVGRIFAARESQVRWS